MSSEADKDTAANIVDLFRQARSVCGDIGKLLSTATAMMKKEGWQAYSSKASILRESVESARHWVPRTCFQYYVRDPNDKKSLSIYERFLPFISVILDEPKHASTLDIALISAGFLDAGVGMRVGNSWSWTDARCHLDNPNRNESGEFIQRSFLRKVENTETQWRGTTLAMPLTEITNSADLETKVVGKLLRRITDELQHKP